MLSDVKFTLDLSQLLKIDYWVNPNPGAGQLLFLIISLKISLLLLVGGVVVWYLKTKKFKNNPPLKSLLTKIIWTLYTFSLISFTLTFFRSQGLGWVSLRLLWLIFGASLLIFASYYLFYFRGRLPVEVKKIANETLKKKYFRTKKKS